MTSPSNGVMRTGGGALTGPVTTPMTRAEVEARIGVGSVEHLHARRWDLVKQGAQRAARVQTWDARRKALKSLILVELHDSYDKGGSREAMKRPAVPILEAMAYIDKRYTDFMDKVRLDIAEHRMAEDEIRSIDETINRDQRLIGFATAEIGKHA